MHEEEYFIPVSKDVMIQSCLYTSDQQAMNSTLCIVTHPYSKWGGSMHNNVVVGIRNQLVKEGFHCVTFNFRGVGRSSGIMGDGTPEQEDLLAVYNYYRSLNKYLRIYLIGYSYGGLISLSAAKQLENLEGMVLISYPVGFVRHLYPDFSISIPLLFIHGVSDDIIPISRVKEIISNFQSIVKFETISTDHFYDGKEKHVGRITCDFVKELSS